MPPKRALVLLVLLACLAPARDGDAQRRDTFEDKLFVREAELVFELPVLPILRTWDFGPDTLLVIEDGNIRPITKVDALEGGLEGGQSAVVWIDQVLARPETVFAATLALARQSAALAQLGTVEVVVAAPEARVELASNREPRRVEGVLAELAGKARVERDRASSRPPDRPGLSSHPDAPTLRRQLDRLLVYLAERRDSGPRLLFLVADGFAVSPAESKAYETGTADPAAGERAAILLETSRLLAAYGWVTVALPMRREDLGSQDRRGNETDEFRNNHGSWSDHSNSVPPVVSSRGPRSSKLRWKGVVDALLQMNLTPLQALVETTAGTLVTHPEVLPSALQGLGARWHLYYQTQTPVDGRLRPIEIRMRDGSTVRSRRWVRASTPEGVAEARLRQLLAGDRLPETLPLQVEASESGLRLTVGAFSAPDPAVPGPVRVSTVYAGENGALVFQHELAPALESPGKGWSDTLPPGAEPLAVLVEDLARERWRAVVITPYSK